MKYAGAVTIIAAILLVAGLTFSLFAAGNAEGGIYLRDQSGDIGSMEGIRIEGIVGDAYQGQRFTLTGQAVESRFAVFEDNQLWDMDKKNDPLTPERDGTWWHWLEIRPRPPENWRELAVTEAKPVDGEAGGFQEVTQSITVEEAALSMRLSHSFADYSNYRNNTDDLFSYIRLNTGLILKSGANEPITLKKQATLTYYDETTEVFDIPSPWSSDYASPNGLVAAMNGEVYFACAADERVKGLLTIYRAIRFEKSWDDSVPCGEAAAVYSMPVHFDTKLHALLPYEDALIMVLEREGLLRFLAIDPASGAELGECAVAAPDEGVRAVQAYDGGEALLIWLGTKNIYESEQQNALYIIGLRRSANGLELEHEIRGHWGAYRTLKAMASVNGKLVVVYDESIDKPTDYYRTRDMVSVFARNERLFTGEIVSNKSEDFATYERYLMGATQRESMPVRDLFILGIGPEGDAQ